MGYSSSGRVCYGPGMQTEDRIWHPYTPRSAEPEGGFPVICRGEGVYLFDTAGRRYFDAISSWWACALGHGHPRIVDAIRRQAGALQHSILGSLSHPPALELARRLSDLAGGGRRVHFASDGASAVEAALKIAVQYRANRGERGRHGFLSFTEPYHGDTLGAVSVGYMEAFHRPFRPLLFPVHRVPAPDCTPCGRGRRPGPCAQPCFDAMRKAVEEHADALAAVVVEPLCQGAAGMRMYAPAYLERLAACCREHVVLLIVDEIATGFCRTGRMFAYQYAGIRPDIICVGKAVTAGALPLSAAVVDDRVYEAFDDSGQDGTFYHGHTFAGNPIAAAAALEALAVYEEEDLAARARELGSAVEAELAPLAGHPHVRDVRCLGLIAAVEFRAEGNGGTLMARQAARCLREQGILIRPLGPVVYLIPPLVAPREELVRVTRRLVACANDLAPSTAAS
jgi:adenosylmethionine-8-amino-7-oxononanoate aminotransferase